MSRTLGPILSLLIALAIFFLFVRPTFSEIRSLQDEIVAYQEAIQNAGQFNTLINNLFAKQNAISAADYDRLDTLVPDHIEGVRALVDIERLAALHGLLFERVELDLASEGSTEGSAKLFSATESVDTGIRNSVVRTAALSAGNTFDSVDVLDMSFNVIGTYEQFRSFMEDLERSAVLMEVTELSFEVSKESELLDVTVSVRLFALPG